MLTLWWQTDELRRIRPRVEDEVRRNLFFFEAVLFDAVPAVLGEIEHALASGSCSRCSPTARWTGGDMDGHPEVGADTLARALQLHRTTALRLFRDRVDRLARVFSHSSLRVPVSQELDASLEHDAEELPSAAVLRRPHREWEPLRTKLGFVHHRLGNTLHAARARARLRRRAGAAARPRARARAPQLAPRRARLDPAAAVAGRRLRLPPRRDRHPPGRGRRARGDGRDPARLRRRRRAAPPGAADRGAGLRPARDRARPRRRGGRAAARARHRRAERRRLRPAGRARRS